MADVWRVCCAWASLRYVYTLLLALAVIENSGDASAAEACTTLRQQQKGLLTWVSDCLGPVEYTIQFVNLLTLRSWTLLRIASEYPFGL